MSNILNEELGRMKSLFHYQKGRVISEQLYIPTINNNKKNKRIQNIANMYATVDNNNIIQAAGSTQNGKKWIDYMTEFRVTP